MVDFQSPAVLRGDNGGDALTMQFSEYKTNATTGNRFVTHSPMLTTISSNN